MAYNPNLNRSEIYNRDTLIQVGGYIYIMDIETAAKILHHLDVARKSGDVLSIMENSVEIANALNGALDCNRAELITVATPLSINLN